MTSRTPWCSSDSRGLIRRKSIFILTGRGLRCKRRTHELRMKIAGFHRLTLAFSRKLANLEAAFVPYFWTFNFCLIHRSLHMTPAMAAHY